MTNLSWTIGEVVVTRVEERIVGVPCESIVPGVTNDHLRAQADWIGPYFTGSGKMLLSNHSFVVQSAGSTIVVDTCVGADVERPLPGDPDFLARLDDAIIGGIDAVDVVLCTHLHFDHVGWNTIDSGGARRPTFPNARYLVTRTELAHWSSTEADVDRLHAVLGTAVQPLLDAGVLDPVEVDHELTDEVRLVPTPGHTPGHVSVWIESRGHRALITGDAAHSPLQFTYPELAATRFDHDSAGSTATRRRLVVDHTDAGTLILGTHFAPPTAGRLRRDAGETVWFDSAP